MKPIFSALVSVIFLYQAHAQQAGSLDLSFGTNGIAQTDPSLSGFENHLNKILVLPDDKFIAVGYWRANSSVNYADLIMVKYNSNGVIDSGFGTNGIVELNISEQNQWKSDFVRSAVLQDDGKIVCVGQTSFSNHLYSMFICRFLSNGELDDDFGIDGVMIFGTVNDDSTEGVAVVEQSDGKLVVATNNYGELGHFIIRFDQNGSLDQSFGTDGLSHIPFQIWDMTIDQADAIYVSTGYNSMAPDVWNFAVHKLNQDGTPDLSFGNVGLSYFNHISILDSTFSSIWADAVEVQADGKILVGGGCEDNLNGGRFFAMGRLNPDGTLDATFGNDGRVFADLPGNRDSEGINDLVVQPDGKIIAIATAGNHYDYAIIRLNSDGSLDSSFGIDGISVFDVSGNQDYPGTAAFQSTGKLLIGGMVGTGSDYDFATLRILTDLNIGIVELTESVSNTLVYPNPIDEPARLQFELAQFEELTISLHDMQGRLVQTFISEQQMNQGKYDLQLQFSKSLEGGTYLLSISSENGQMGIRVIKR